MAAFKQLSVSSIVAVLMLLAGSPHSGVLRSTCGQALAITIDSGAQFVEQLQAAYASDINSTFLIPANLTLAGTNYTMLNRTVSSTLTLSPANASGSAVIDLAMKPPALLGLGASATQYGTNLTFVNGWALGRPRQHGMQLVAPAFWQLGTFTCCMTCALHVRTIMLACATPCHAGARKWCLGTQPTSQLSQRPTTSSQCK